MVEDYPNTFTWSHNDKHRFLYQFKDVVKNTIIPSNSPLLCYCSSYSDLIGDHLVGCGHGSYRIKYNVLRYKYYFICLTSTQYEN